MLFLPLGSLSAPGRINAPMEFRGEDPTLSREWTERRKKVVTLTVNYLMLSSFLMTFEVTLGIEAIATLSACTC